MFSKGVVGVKLFRDTEANSEWRPNSALLPGFDIQLDGRDGFDDIF